MKRLLAAAALMAGVTATAMAAEFQTIGTMGMGGAGVARDMGAYAPYWNPAGLAFATKSFSTTIGAGVGARVSDGLADNVDNLSKFTEGSPSTFDNLTNITTVTPGAYPAVAADITSLLTVVNELGVQKGALSANADAAAGFQMKQFGTGVFMLSEGYGKTASVDLVNVLPGNGSAALDINSVATLVGPQANNTTFFTPQQITAMETSLLTVLPGAANATARADIINSLANNLQSPANPNLPRITPDQAVDTFTRIVVPAFASNKSVNDNQTAVMVKNVLFTEIPISYGHAISLGGFGKLGIGGSFKVVNGRVYQTRIGLVENGTTVTVDDIIDGLKDNYVESTNVTFDLGTQWKYSDWLTVGVVAKNLTTPTFKSPELKDQKGRLVLPDGTFTTTPYREDDVKLKPQARMGIALVPLAWLTIAADIDLTRNETVLQGLDYKNQHLGGGIELSPLTWLKIRGGMYKNLANTEIGPVATAGLTFGFPAVQLEVDGAYSLDTTRYDNHSYPKESRIQAQLAVQY